MYHFTFNDASDLGTKKSQIEGWKAWACEVAIGGYIVTGSAGSDTDEEDADKVVVTNDDLTAAAKEYEEQGRCWNCKGSGEVFHSWNHKTGVKNKTCNKRSGTGTGSA
jgi:hypothetical protein